jgi:hypothetical protein
VQRNTQFTLCKNRGKGGRSASQPWDRSLSAQTLTEHCNRVGSQPTISAAKQVLPFVIGIALILPGCGTYVPEIQEIPGGQRGEELIHAIVGSIHCEIIGSVKYVIDQDRRNAYTINNGRLYADWLLGWGAQIQLTLQVNEQSTLSPSGSWSPMGVFFLGGGASGSSAATRIDITNYYYTIKDLDQAPPCDAATESTIADHPIGSLLIQSDLKLREWLLSAVVGRGTGDINFTPSDNPIAKNAISHEVKFEVITSGNITPMWKLAHSTINPTGSLFSTSRDRVHDLLITLGPNVKTPVAGPGQPPNSLGVFTPAAGTFLASQIGLASRNQMISISP